MKIGIISGCANTGKTTTCFEIKKIYLNQENSTVVKEFNYKKGIKDQERIIDERDCLSIVKIDDKYYGISSQGDVPNHIGVDIEKIMNYAKSHGFEFESIILTCRSKGNGLAAAREIAPKYGAEEFFFISSRITREITEEDLKNHKREFAIFILKAIGHLTISEENIQLLS